MLGIAGQFPFQRGCRSAGQFRRRGIDDGKDRSFPIERLFELVVALAPVQVGRDQRVDVGVDDEVPGRVNARRHREDKCDQYRERGKPRANFDNRYDDTGQHSSSF